MSKKVVLRIASVATALYLCFVLWISFTVIPFGETWDVRGTGQQLFSVILLIPLIPIWGWLLRKHFLKRDTTFPIRHPEDGMEDTSRTTLHTGGSAHPPKLDRKDGRS